MSIKQTIKKALTNKKINEVLNSDEFNQVCDKVSDAYKKQGELLSNLGDALGDPTQLKKAIRAIHQDNKEHITNIAMTIVDSLDVIKKDGAVMLKNIEKNDDVKSFKDRIVNIYKKLL